jgi:hypothetical protein
MAHKIIKIVLILLFDRYIIVAFVTQNYLFVYFYIDVVTLDVVVVVVHSIFIERQFSYTYLFVLWPSSLLL